MAIKISTGETISIPIEFEGKNDTDYLVFNANDPDLLSRFNKFAKNVDNKIKDFDFSLTPEGLPKYQKDILQYDMVIAAIKEEIDEVFKADISSVAFKHCSPFTIINSKKGTLFIEALMEAVANEIANHMKKYDKSMTKKMNKHTSKYGVVSPTA